MLTLNIVGRIPIVMSEIYMVITFVTLFRYFLVKKYEILVQLNSKFTRFNLFVIGAIIFITFLKVVETPLLIINGLSY
jgi:hypothetical protein